MADDIYLNIYDYKDKRYPFQVFIGSRGCGKTFSALRGLVQGELAPNRQFIYMRRTQDELDLICDGKNGEGANPFKPINDMYSTNYGFTNVVPHLLGMYHRTINDNGGYDYEGQPLGYGVALSTIAKIRGLSFDNCDILIYDEFIKEKHVRRMKGECDAFFNALETFNRNRELTERDPIQAYLLANSNDIYNDIFLGLGVVTDIERMIKQGKQHRYFTDRGLAIHVLGDNPAYVEKKSKTALYKLTQGTQFSNMALHNDFSYNDFSDIKHLELKGYDPVIGIGKAYVYRKKGEQRFYVTYAEARVPHLNSDNILDRQYFNRTIGMKLYDYSMIHAITYESYELKELIFDIIGLTK